MHHCFVDKNQYIKKNLAVELESLADKVDKSVNPERKEQFHEYLR